MSGARPQGYYQRQPYRQQAAFTTGRPQPLREAAQQPVSTPRRPSDHPDRPLVRGVMGDEPARRQPGRQQPRLRMPAPEELGLTAHRSAASKPLSLAEQLHRWGIVSLQAIRLTDGRFQGECRARDKQTGEVRRFVTPAVRSESEALRQALRKVQAQR